MEAYLPPLVLRNGHLNTIFPALWRKPKPLNFFRKRLELPDGDFLDVDLIKANYKRLAILCHGLEGSSNSQYINGASALLSNSKWDVAAINYRGCSGQMNRLKRFYHSGATDDLHHVVSAFSDSYSEIALIGYSLGGNIVLKYCGDGVYHLSDKIIKAIAISVPVDLGAGSQEIRKRKNYFYEKNFLKSLKDKIIQKEKLIPGSFNIESVNQAKTLFEFDDVVTASLGGFKNANDYYEKCSSKQFLKNIKISSTIINAEDDPFLPLACYPREASKSNSQLELIIPKFGGHVGFSDFNSSYYWIEKLILKSINEISELN